MRQLYLKDTSAQVFSSEHCEIFTNSFFHRTLPVTAFGERSIDGTCNC